MKPVVIAAMLFAVFCSCSLKPRLYSREAEEQRIADSLKVVDSLRVVDSIRIADSMMIARYRTADATLKKEKQHHLDSTCSAMFVFEEREKVPGVQDLDDDADAVSARSIEIDPDSPQAKKIDSLEAEYDRRNSRLHDGDDHFRKMKRFAVSEKKRYMRFLLKHKMKDTAQIAAYCNSLAELYRIRLAFFVAIQESQQGNTKSFVRLHIEEHKRKMEELSNFILALSPDVPFRPDHKLSGDYPE